MAGYLADPGGVFDSDTHRRVLGHLPLPGTDPMPTRGPAGRKAHTRSLGHRLSADAHHRIQTVDELEEVLKDLEADGYAGQTKAGWKMTKAGLDKLNGPNANEPDPDAEPEGPAPIGGLDTGGLE